MLSRAASDSRLTSAPVAKRLPFKTCFILGYKNVVRSEIRWVGVVGHHHHFDFWPKTAGRSKLCGRGHYHRHHHHARTNPNVPLFWTFSSQVLAQSFNTFKQNCWFTVVPEEKNFLSTVPSPSEIEISIVLTLERTSRALFGMGEFCAFHWHSLSQRSKSTQHSRQTDIHAPGVIRAHNLSWRAAAHLRLRPRGHYDWLNVMQDKRILTTKKKCYVGLSRQKLS